MLTMVAAIALPAATSSAALAAPRGKEVSVASSGATDISARRRVHRGGAAAAAAFAGIVGTGLAIAAEQNRRAYYDEYYGSPRYYAPGPTYYYGQRSYYPYGNGYYSGW
jgi:hypothetical protein